MNMDCLHRPLVLSSPTSLRPRATADICLLGPRSCRRALAGQHVRLNTTRQPQQAGWSRTTCPTFSCAYGRVASMATLASGSLGLPDDCQSHYLFGQVIGSGAYGTVRFAYNKHSSMECAVKVLPKVRGNAPVARTLRKLQRELQMHSRVQDCPNVVYLYDAFEDVHNIYLVLELCRGKSLERVLLDNGAMSEQQTALVMYEVLKVIAGCHAKGVLHGDVKPANWVFARELDDTGVEGAAAAGKSWLKAVDFGCSQRWTGQPFATRVGTPVFMSPECFMRQYDLASDVWSAGIMLYQLFAYRFPFWPTMDGCKAQTLDEVMHAVTGDKIAFNYGPWRKMSPAGLDLAKKMLTRDPARRITAAEALQHRWFKEQLQINKNNILLFGGADKPPADGAKVGPDERAFSRVV